MMKYFNRYPQMNFRYHATASVPDPEKVVDVDACRNCIIDLHEAMLASGMVQIQLDGQYDVYGNTNFDSTGTSIGILYSAKSLVYTFNDELNSRFPLYVKLRIGLTPTTARNGVSSYSSRLCVWLYVSQEPDLTSFDCRMVNALYPSASTSSVAPANFRSWNSEGESEIINKNNIFFMNICPNLGFTSNQLYGITIYPLLFGFMQRFDDGSYIFMSYANSSTPTGAILEYTDASLNTLNDIKVEYKRYNAAPINYTNEILSLISPPLTNYDSKVTFVPTQIIIDGVPQFNPDLLLVSKGLFSSYNRFMKIPVKLDDNTTVFYKPITPTGFPCRFNDNNTAIMIRVDEDE